MYKKTKHSRTTTGKHSNTGKQVCQVSCTASKPQWRQLVDWRNKTLTPYFVATNFISSVGYFIINSTFGLQKTLENVLYLESYKSRNSIFTFEFLIFYLLINLLFINKTQLRALMFDLIRYIIHLQFFC